MPGKHVFAVVVWRGVSENIIDVYVETNRREDTKEGTVRLFTVKNPRGIVINRLANIAHKDREQGDVRPMLANTPGWKWHPSTYEQRGATSPGE